MEDKQLDLNRPFPSVRRYSPARLIAGVENRDDDGSISSSAPIPKFISELKSGPVSVPGTVPFQWEESPGKPKYKDEALHIDSPLADGMKLSTSSDETSQARSGSTTEVDEGPYLDALETLPRSTSLLETVHSSEDGDEVKINNDYDSKHLPGRACGLAPILSFVNSCSPLKSSKRAETVPAQRLAGRRIVGNQRGKSKEKTLTSRTDESGTYRSESLQSLFHKENKLRDETRNLPDSASADHCGLGCHTPSLAQTLGVA